MDNDIFKPRINSRMNLENVYFWTDTIKDWKHLFLKQNDCRMCVQYATEHVGEFYTKSIQ